MEINFNEDYLQQAHKASFQNQEQIQKSNLCGCFYCEKIFNANLVDDWVNDKEAKTAICPYCGIDSVLGDASDYEITERFLHAMRKKFF